LLRSLRLAAVNLSFLGLSQIAVTAAAFATQVVLARSLSQHDFGSFMTVLAFVSLTAPIAVYGVNELWLQRFGREGPKAFRWVRRSIGVVIAATAVVMMVMLLWGLADLAYPVDAGLRILLIPVVAAQAFIALAMSALQLRGAYKAVAALQLAPHLGRIAVVVVTGTLGLTVLHTALGYALIAVATLTLSVLVLDPYWRGRVRLEGHPAGPPPPGQPPSHGRLFRSANPFMLGSLFYLVGLYLGTVVVGEFLGTREAALFSVPMSILMAIYLIPRVVYQQYFLAKLQRWARNDRDMIFLAYRVGTTGMVIAGCVIAVLVAVGGAVGIPRLFGEQYSDSVPILLILVVAIPMRFGAASVASLLTTSRQLWRKVAYQGGGVVVYLTALAIATPRYGLLGAAASTVVAELALLILFWIAVKKYVVYGARLPSWGMIRQRLRKGLSNA
jgi:O-antigen/teichoic acid export membrane protein